MRTYIDFNADWKFSKMASVPETFPEEWESVTLPHTWNAVDGQDGGNDYYRGTCTYAKRFAAPERKDGDRVFLEFQGAAMTADVYLNGAKLAHHEGGYSTFRVDLTEALGGAEHADNLLCVTVDNGANDRVYPQKADFTFYGGIYREVSMILVPASHFELLESGTPGIRVTPRLEGDEAVIEAECPVTGGDRVLFTILPGVCEGTDDSRAAAQSAAVQKTAEGRNTVISQKTSAAQSEVIVQGAAEVAEGKAQITLRIPSPHLWDGTNDPYLYTICAVLMEGGEERDSVSARFGVRTFAFDPEKGFMLNGRPYPLRGVSRHQDREGVGPVLTEEMHREDMELIREIGANTIRLAHYQHAQTFYDLADEYGMVVWAEIPYITHHMPAGRDNTLSQMRELITQCYNHPSVVCWGLSNEITASGAVTEDLMENHRLLNELCHEMDATRPTTMAHVFMLETDQPIVGLADICSYNLYFGWYLGELEQNDRFFDDYHRNYPERIIGFSEYGADANIRFQTSHPEKGDYTEQYQALYHEHLLKCIEERPYLWATHVWNLFDFAADGRDEGGAHGRNQKGLVSFDRKTKKDAFYLYKAAWNHDEPFVHLCGGRYTDRAEEETEIKVYSNQARVTLFVDGTEYSTQESERIFRFRIPVSGEHQIRAIARRTEDGQEQILCSDEIRIRKTAEPNPDYIFQKQSVVNWFDAESFQTDCFSVKDTFGEVMAHPQASRILQGIMAKARASRGDVAASTEGNAVLQKMMAGMTIESLLKQAGEAVGPEQVKAVNAALQKIKK